MNISKTDLYNWCESHFQEHLTLLKELAVIPAPSHHEDMRVKYIENWLLSNGAQNVRVDIAKNVILTLGDCDNSMLAVMAHTDVVFPDTSPLPLFESDGKLFAPGIGDDTANVAALMLCAKFFITHPELLPEPVLIVFNSCEEGLGNLKGVRQIMQDYAGQIHSLVSFDLQSDSIISRAVGSQRWQIDVSTCGGHSYSDFGRANAIAELSKLIVALYQQQIPNKKDCCTTYNVGIISGGTSVNTIAQHAHMTYEYRSDDQECLAYMEKQFHQLLQDCYSEETAYSVTNIGTRPCGSIVDIGKHNALLNRCASSIQEVYGITPRFCAASTDANIPLSMGIPAATFGLYRGEGMHTREEYVEISSLTPGLKVALSFFLAGHLSS